MSSHILQTAQEFERYHGVAPNVININTNPMHFAALSREYPEPFEPGQNITPEFRMIVVPGSQLAHPQAACWKTSGPFVRTTVVRGGAMPPSGCRWWRDPIWVRRD